jgi:hypothetical protein
VAATSKSRAAGKVTVCDCERAAELVEFLILDHGRRALRKVERISARARSAMRIHEEAALARDDPEMNPHVRLAGFLIQMHC